MSYKYYIEQKICNMQAQDLERRSYKTKTSHLSRPCKTSPLHCDLHWFVTFAWRSVTINKTRIYVRPRKHPSSKYAARHASSGTAARAPANGCGRGRSLVVTRCLRQAVSVGTTDTAQMSVRNGGVTRGIAADLIMNAIRRRRKMVVC